MAGFYDFYFGSKEFLDFRNNYYVSKTSHIYMKWVNMEEKVKLPMCLSIMPWRCIRNIEVQHCKFSTLALDIGLLIVLCSSCFIPG